ncbi:rhodoquinone biosynthesis methyltransferase RquA [Aquitalea denitrificans]|uniref:rhodoquinone biosynthesis methyltransferase RquA n=1 Tax=Aquitalea denitrificans TaxID=519081 RepID=UPI00135C2FE5|nr:rhodoquinone biosynthesis methyltransferase RquA [Aquitalea denitrificans]
MSRNHPPLPCNPYYEGVPDYMTEVYDWAYVNPRRAALLDRNLVVSTLLFLNDQRLMQRYLQQIRPGMRVWQVAHVYGDLVQKAAAKVRKHGEFILTDITPVQVEHGARKLAAYPQARVVRADAASYQLEQPADLICSFFLLHEVPDDLKHRIVDNMLSQLQAGGRAVFVDYHKPAPWQPVGWLLKWVNRVLEPFAEALWRNEISSYASDAEAFDWHKETLFGGVYQVLTVTRR